MQAVKNPSDRIGWMDRAQYPHAPAAAGTFQNIHLEHPLEKVSPCIIPGPAIELSFRISSETKPEVHPAPVVQEPGTEFAPRNNAAAPRNNDVARKPVERERRAVQPAPVATQRSTREPASPPAIEKALQPAAATASPAAKEAIPAARVEEPKQTPLQEAVGKMTVSLLLYAEAEADRSVWINGRKYVKGDRVDGLYLVESITAEGVVLELPGRAGHPSPAEVIVRAVSGNVWSENTWVRASAGL